jgi:flagellar protein FlaG
LQEEDDMSFQKIGEMAMQAVPAQAGGARPPGVAAAASAVPVAEGAGPGGKTAAAESPPAARELRPEERLKIAERLQDLARASRRQLEFRVDQDSNRVVISVRDERTGELIRQIPDATALRISQRLESQAEALRHVLFEGHA